MSNYVGKSELFHSQIFFSFKLIIKQNPDDSVSWERKRDRGRNGHRGRGRQSNRERGPTSTFAQF